MNIEEKYSQNSQEFAYLGLMEEMRMEALLLALLQEGDSALEEGAMEYGDKIIQLKDEIRDTEMLLERLRRLLADYGKSDNILQEIAAGQRLELTEGMDVLIDGKKISMTPLPKALFLLFWRHPEGICFKDMSDYREELVKGGMVLSGLSPDGNIVEMVELPREVHPFFVATQAHPEFKSRPNRPHPLFRGFVRAALDYSEKEGKE